MPNTLYAIYMVDSVFNYMVKSENKHHDELLALHNTHEVRTHMHNILVYVKQNQVLRYVAYTHRLERLSMQLEWRSRMNSIVRDSDHLNIEKNKKQRTITLTYT